MKKKLAAVLSLTCAAVLACFGFAACGGDEEPPEKEEPTADVTDESFDYEKKTWSFTNYKGEAATLDYGVYVPDSWSATGTKLPLITYVPDSGYVDKTVDYLAQSGECLDHWITSEKMASSPAVFLFLTFSSANAVQEGQEITGLCDVTVAGTEAAEVVNIIDQVVKDYNIDTNRLYLTGQSMGGILDWSLNTAYPDKFAATVYVACQPGDNYSTPEEPNEMYDSILAAKEFVDQKFVYIASRTDMKAPTGQDDVEKVLIAEGKTVDVDYGKKYDLDKSDLEGDSALLRTLFANGYDHYFIGFPDVAGGVNGGFEHLRSFDPAYSLDAIFEWLMAQSL